MEGFQKAVRSVARTEAVMEELQKSLRAMADEELREFAQRSYAEKVQEDVLRAVHDEFGRRGISIPIPAA